LYGFGKQNIGEEAGNVKGTEGEKVKFLTFFTKVKESDMQLTDRS